MKIKISRLISFILSVVIVCNAFFYGIAYASETELDPEILKKMKEFEDARDNQDKWRKIENIWWTYILSQTGALFNGDMAQIRENDETRRKELADTWDNPQWRKDNIQIITGDIGKVPNIKLTKEVSQLVLDITKKATKEPENGGYELMKTVPLSKISMLYFNTGAIYSTLYNLIKENNGIIGLHTYYGNGYFYKIPNNIFWIKGTQTINNSATSYKDCTLNIVKGLKDLNGGYMSFSPYCLSNQDNIVKRWEELTGGTNSRRYGDVRLLDVFNYFIEVRDGNNPLSAEGGIYLITQSGASIPVFNTINDAVAYSVANNLYYTGSDYTGEGKEIIIPFDEIDKILNGYYNGMYDLLQQLIEQNGGNALTPEQLQELVDEVKASFGMIQDTINKGFEQQDILIQKNSQILQNIADALNKFFSQTKESRTAFLKEFKDYAKDQQTRDDALYKLISDYIESTKNNNPDTPEPSLPPPPDPGDNTDTTDSSAWHEKLYNTIKKGFDDVVDGLKKGFDGVVEELKKIKRWTALDTLLDGAGAVGEWVSLLTDLLDPEKRLGTLTDFVGTAMDALNDTTNLVKGKFPFCIPVDILALMQTLSAEPQTPVFKIPFVIESWDIHAEVEIDLKDFDIISDISRTFLTILWCCALMNFTTKITDMKSI